MERLTRHLVRRLIRDHERIDDLRVRARYGQLEGWVSVAVNSVLFVVKLALGLAVGSVGLVADAVHTLADSATSGVIIVGFRLAARPSDREHPFGHGRMEAVASLVVSVLLFVAGAELFRISVNRTLFPSVSAASTAVIVVIAAMVLVKELLAEFAYVLADMIGSKALAADAAHHRSDVAATVLVVLGLMAARLGWDRVDGAAGVLVSLFILHLGFSLAREAVTPLLGEAPSRRTLDEIVAAARSNAEVLGVHDIIVHDYGGTRLASLHLEVSDKTSVVELHDLADRVADAVGEKVGAHVVVHVDPVSRDHPRYRAVRETLKGIAADDERIQSFHDLRIRSSGEGTSRLVVDIVPAEDLDEKEAREAAAAVREALSTEHPDMRIVVQTEPKYTYTLPGREAEEKRG